MEKGDRTDFFRSVYLKWIEQSVDPDRDAINSDIIGLYCEFLKEYIEYEEIEKYCRTVGENEYTITELKSIWKHVGNVFDISINITIPAKFENEALDRIKEVFQDTDLDYKIDKCTLVENKRKDEVNNR